MSITKHKCFELDFRQHSNPGQKVTGNRGEAFAELLRAEAPIACSAAGLTRPMMHPQARYKHPEAIYI